LSLKEPFNDQSHPKNDRLLTKLGMWLILFVCFFNGGLLLNFIFFMASNLEAESSEYQPEFVYKVFLIFFVLGRITVLLMSGFKCSKDRIVSDEVQPRVSIYQFIRENIKIYLSIGFLAVLGVGQVVSISQGQVSKNKNTGKFNRI